ncbi:MAG: hypothetical protein HY820_44450 [Acidobacteria bacterium]|nr:hypothetical protein [Acidobacteriota bacterium]
MDFSGRTIEWRGWVKTQAVTNAAALWMREDGDTAGLAFNTTQGLQVKGDTDWKQYSITLSVVPDAKLLFVGFLIVGTGTAWVDDLELLVDGKPIAEAPARITVLDNDKEFDGSSKISLSAVSETQARNLARLARVWGFLKYHHPAVTGGKRHWDYDLFRIMPQVLAAPEDATANKAINEWITALGPVAECTRCATLNPSSLHLEPSLDWIRDESVLGAELSRTLQTAYRNRPVATSGFYISLVPGVQNAVFENELTYRSVRFPDSGYQLLGLFRYRNMVEYFSPYRDVMMDDPTDLDYWPRVLEESIAAIALAGDSVGYQQELLKFIAKVNDTHANLWSSIASRPPIGTCQLPVDLRFVEGKAIVRQWNSATAGPESGLKPGDVIEELEGATVDDLLAGWRPYYADSNEATRYRDYARYMTRGACGPVSVLVNRGEEFLRVDSTRVPISILDFSRSSVHDRPGPAFQKLADDVAYLKLSSVEAAKSASYVEAAAGTKGLIIDIRNYPSEFVVYTLGSLLTSSRVPFVNITRPDVSNPGAFYWTPPLELVPAQPHYNGKVVVLLEEVSQSQAEFTAMAFRAAGATIIGSTTAGSDGNVSTILLPGGFSSYISGIGIFNPDKTPTQRVGIIPDIELRPTIAGIREGRDELLEAAIRQIRGQ